MDDGFLQVAARKPIARELLFQANRDAPLKMEILNQLPLCFTQLLLRPARLIESDVLAGEVEARIHFGFWTEASINPGEDIHHTRSQKALSVFVCQPHADEARAKRMSFGEPLGRVESVR